MRRLFSKLLNSASEKREKKSRQKISQHIDWRPDAQRPQSRSRKLSKSYR
jgi:hypothetical protein